MAWLRDDRDFLTQAEAGEYDAWVTRNEQLEEAEWKTTKDTHRIIADAPPHSQSASAGPVPSGEGTGEGPKARQPGGGIASAGPVRMGEGASAGPKARQMGVGHVPGGEGPAAEPKAESIENKKVTFKSTVEKGMGRLHQGALMARVCGRR